MMSSEASSTETLEHAHLVLSRDKQAMAVMSRDAMVIEATLRNDLGLVEISIYDIWGLPCGMVNLPLVAFDEILEMIVCFGRA